MKIGVLAQEDYMNNGLQTFESNVVPWLLEDERFEPIYYKVENGYPFSRTIQTIKLRNKVQEQASKFDKIFVPAQNRLRFDPKSVDTEIVPYVHDVLPYTSEYKKDSYMFLRPFMDAVKNKLNAEYLPHLAKVDTAMAASKVSQNDLTTRTAFRGESHVVYQGVDDMPDLDFELEERKIDLLYVGELFERKNPEMVKKSLKRAEEAGFKVATVNFDGHDDLPGRTFEDVSDDKLAGIYSDSRYILHASFMEGFGRCPVEAQRYGCIPLALDIPINREILGNPQFGMWQPVSSAEEVVRELENEVQPEMRSSAVSNSERYDWQSCRERIKEVLLE